MAILFSAVGNNDPGNNYDGPLLHICRHYKPSIVYAVMSKDILKNEKKDRRYSRSIELLSQELINSQKSEKNPCQDEENSCQDEEKFRQIEFKILEEPELEDVHLFDPILINFEKYLLQIMEDHPDEEIVLNLSSGTPAMKGALNILSAFYPYKTKGVQVASPPFARKNASKKESTFDVDEFWKNNKDNKPLTEKRDDVNEPQHLMLKMQKGIMEKFIRRYDYRGALLTAQNIEKGLDPLIIDALKWAAFRYELNHEEMDLIQQKYKNTDSASQDNSLFLTQSYENDYDRNTAEYVLSVQVRLKRKAYVDFLRSITPLVIELFERVLNQVFGINLDKCTDFEESGVRVWSEEKRELNECKEILDALDFQYDRITKGRRKFKAEGPVYSDNLLQLIVYGSKHCPVLEDASSINLKELRKTSDDVRRVESKARNTAAHEMVTINDQWIEDKTDLTSEEIMDAIRRLCEFAGLKVDWDSYDKMNNQIIAKLDQTNNKA